MEKNKQIQKIQENSILKLDESKLLQRGLNDLEIFNFDNTLFEEFEKIDLFYFKLKYDIKKQIPFKYSLLVDYNKLPDEALWLSFFAKSDILFLEESYQEGLLYVRQIIDNNLYSNILDSIYHQQGNYFYKLKNFTDAINSYKKSMEISLELEWENLKMLARCFYLLNNKKQALECINKSIELEKEIIKKERKIYNKNTDKQKLDFYKKYPNFYDFLLKKRETISSYIDKAIFLEYDKKYNAAIDEYNNLIEDNNYREYINEKILILKNKS